VEAQRWLLWEVELIPLETRGSWSLCQIKWRVMRGNRWSTMLVASGGGVDSLWKVLSNYVPESCWNRAGIVLESWNRAGAVVDLWYVPCSSGLSWFEIRMCASRHENGKTLVLFQFANFFLFAFSVGAMRSFLCSSGVVRFEIGRCASRREK